ncbi:hypothetical protein AYM40_35340 [Paraburkholderia phytofirmans OLGA172]|uniref:Uncharacterized protein n=1 Tax=Paraburkholderia phytofirmans OLGA172 TaxID=1417228 RepID=A0A160FW02_9BURK|nr:hypothetical protein [Paraburkholderia phytofirmans]ANB77352.1 hypothetical protein AYM40_35340 [Paraburkholderia phytofirmans OLGA172]
MSIGKVKPLTEEHDIVLIRWRVLRADNGTDRLVGARLDDFDGRVSSALTEFDRERMVATTRSGRVYLLQGPPGYNADAEYVWEFVCKRDGIKEFADVTREYYPASDVDANNVTEPSAAPSTTGTQHSSPIPKAQ